MNALENSDAIDQHRRRFCGTAAITLAVAQLGMIASSAAQAGEGILPGACGIKSGPLTLFGPIRQIDTGLLSVGYAEAGPSDGPVVILLHGWPYHIHSFGNVAPLLASQGNRVIVPNLRGFGSTQFLSASTLRNGEQAAVAHDTIGLMNALKIEKSGIGGFDWGAPTAAVIAARWPDRCKNLGFRRWVSDREFV